MPYMTDTLTQVDQLSSHTINHFKLLNNKLIQIKFDSYKKKRLNLKFCKCCFYPHDGFTLPNTLSTNNDKCIICNSTTPNKVCDQCSITYNACLQCGGNLGKIDNNIKL